jgi:hypothetical protein
MNTLRDHFFKKKLEYACSFDSTMVLLLQTVAISPYGLRASLRPRRGELFHVLDALSVSGVDGAKHESPKGAIESLEESICFDPERLRAEVKGRASFRIAKNVAGRHDRSWSRIYMTYSGTLRFRSVPLPLFDAIPDPGRHVNLESPERSPVVARAWIVPSFFTEDSRYKWLGQVGCVAFGTWTAEPRRDCPVIQDVTTELDIYAAGLSRPVDGSRSTGSETSPARTSVG